MFPQGNPPAFAVDEPAGIYIWLGEGLGFVGVRQMDDDSTILSVTELTKMPADMFTRGGLSLQDPVFSGQYFKVVKDGREGAVIQSGILSASRRMALGIPLHPDRMTREDWLELKGIGPVLADRIEAYRQKNGEFGTLQRLREVKGIGPKRIAAWKRFF